MTKRILLIEDAADIALLISLELKTEGYDVDVVSDGLQGLIHFRQNSPDLVILDWVLPEMDGIEVCRRIRKTSTVPILMLTGKTEVDHRVAGLDAGANDYLLKPFHLEELLARVRAQFRIAEEKTQHNLRYGDITIDLTSRDVWRGTQKLDLSAKEFDLLVMFVKHPTQIMSKSQILKTVWDWDFEGEDNIVEVYIHKLRRKLNTEGKESMLHTVRGVGYVLTR